MSLNPFKRPRLLNKHEALAQLEALQEKEEKKDEKRASVIKKKSNKK